MKNKNQKRKQITGIRFFLFIFILFFLSVSDIYAQNRNISGIVFDNLGKALPGVTIAIVGSPQGAVTNIDGKYSLEVSNKAVLRVSFVGFKTKMIAVPDDKSVLDITMEEDVIALKETIVYAMGMRRDEKSIATAVQEIDVTSMAETRDGNFLNMLAGRAAGLQVISNGSPGSSTRVVIRGNNSITGNNQPLYVIDGIPIMNPMGDHSNNLDYGNPANNINPDDIENLVILKGANAAALYGSDAANGVVLITTKKAKRKNGKGITYSSNLQFHSLMQYPIYQNIYGVGAGSRLNDGYNYYNSDNIPYDSSLPWGIVRLTSKSYNQRSYGAPMLGFIVQGRNGELKTFSPHPNNVTEMYKDGHTWANNVSIDKVTDLLTIRLSYSNRKTDDILDNFNILNNNSLNLTTTTKVTDFFSIDVNARYNNEQATNRGYRGSSDRNPLYSIAWMPRDINAAEMTPWKNPDKTALIFPGGFNNPYWLLNELSNGDEKHNLLADATMNFNLTKGFRLRLRAAIDMNIGQGWNFINKHTPFDVDGEFQNFSEIARSDTYEGMLMYEKRWKRFSLSSGLGVWQQHSLRKKERAAVYTLLQPDDKTLSNNGGTAVAWEEYDNKEKQAVFGTASLGYNDFLYLELTGRNDWSSALPANSRSYFYSSAGLSFILTEVIKIPKQILSFAKFRASTATVGNDTGFDRLLDGYNYGNLYLGDMPWYRADDVRKNPDLKPEKTLSNEFGADLRFWDNRIGLDITYYTKKTTNQIIESKISASSGYDRAMYNSGEIKNWGTEISLNFVPIRTERFEWNSTLNWANNRSKVVSLVNDMESMVIHSDNVEVRAVVGRSFGTLYGLDWKRDENGNVLVDSNGRTIEEQGVFLGDVSPDWIGGWRNAFRVGRLEFACLFDFKKGGVLWSKSASQSSADGQSLASLQGRDEHLFSTWVLGENDNERKGILEPNFTVNANANLQENAVQYYDNGRLSGIRILNAYYDPSVYYLAGRASYVNISPMDYWCNGRNAHLFTYDASFIKLKEVSVGYNFSPQLMRYLSFFQSVRLSAVGRNLAILHQKTPQGLDPEATTSMGNGQGIESGFNLPTRSLGFDLHVTF
ncbi:MAG: SusC/RagA family TonB-linked outer membrane protein [Dysgonamonadaceae bacterium]|jgi:TonB-linked SusC/RagA family outer membrane protein|nr:SusC/RagA family TonB-linked outer membrane protein [Dysgonamonadaceae bacterium]